MDVSLYQFVGSMLILLGLWMAYSLRGVNIREYFRTRTGLGILKGIVMAVGITLGAALVAGLAGCSTGTYFNDAHVYAGLDQTKGQSPQCKEGGPDDRATSNLGFKGNIYQSADERFRANAKYTHHSCAFSPDRNGYDAVGIELEYKLWERK